MYCRCFFGYIRGYVRGEILGYILGYALGYVLGIKPYIGVRFCVDLLPQRYSHAVIDPGLPAASECSPGRRLFKRFTQRFLVRPIVRL